MEQKKELTKAEEQVMQIMWKLNKKVAVKELLDEMDEPIPAYNTVSTIVRILETKGFVDHEPFGKGYLYFPIIAKSDYTKSTFKTMVSGYFNGSFKEMVSFMVREEKISLSDVEELLNELKETKTK